MKKNNENKNNNTSHAVVLFGIVLRQLRSMISNSNSLFIVLFCDGKKINT